MTEYWLDMYMCRRKGFCHVTAHQCLEAHDVSVCGHCENFLMILELDERRDIDETMHHIERRALAPKRKARA
jgi:hypothetical protein